MSQIWLEANEKRLAADILRDFCSLSVTLQEQFIRFDSAGNLSFSVLRELVGDMMDKGLLWRLKDTTHHILRDSPTSAPDSRLLDWAIGYIFHETIKLMEDTHQRQYYAPRLLALAVDNPMTENDTAAKDFTDMAVDTQADMARGIARIRRLLAHAKRFFHRGYKGQSNNRHLARLLYDKENLIRAAFLDTYNGLIEAIYGDMPEKLHLEAAAALYEGNRIPEAEAAFAKARAIAPHSPLLRGYEDSLCNYAKVKCTSK